MQIVVVLLTMMYRNLDRMVVWLFAPHDDMLLVESESKVSLVCSLSWRTTVMPALPRF